MLDKTLKRSGKENASENMEQAQLPAKRAALEGVENRGLSSFAGNMKEAIGQVPESAAILKPSNSSQAAKRLHGLEDIDANDGQNLSLVSEYVNEIYDYLYKLEIELPIHKDHLAGQLEVTREMRSVVVDWINEVHLWHQLAEETYQLAVAIIDRYLQAVRCTTRNNLQLVGVTALLMATKYEELSSPHIEDFVYITDDAYSIRQIRLMELKILKGIDFNLSRPLPIHFLRRYSKAAGSEGDHHALSRYFVELASVDYDCCSYKPSEIAAASLFLSLNLLRGNDQANTGLNDDLWTPTLAHYSRYSATHLRPITRHIAKLARDAPEAKLTAVYTKFKCQVLMSELSGPLMDSIVGESDMQ